MLETSSKVAPPGSEVEEANWASSGCDSALANSEDAAFAGDEDEGDDDDDGDDRFVYHVRAFKTGRRFALGVANLARLLFKFGKTAE